MSEPSSIFDMVGPVMVGPSSSHTAGVVRIGNAAHFVLGGVPEKAEITFYNSFARTFEGHGSHRAALAGLMGLKTDDEKIRDSLEIAQTEGIDFTFKPIGNASIYHPNTVKFKISRGKKEAEVIGESLGAAVINLHSIDGFRAHVGLKLPTLMILAEDQPGKIGFVANILANDRVNIATMSVSRKEKNDLACFFIEMDSELPRVTVSYLNHLTWVKKILELPKIDL
jgi:L-serine dehydratase